MACVASLCAGLAASSGASGDEHASKAMEWLRRAICLGLFRNPDLLDALDHNSDLDFLRPRRDFQLLRLDATFPTDPLARGR